MPDQKQPIPTDEVIQNLTEALGAIRGLLDDANKGVSVREYVDRWDRAWAGREDLRQSIDAAQEMLALVQSEQVGPEHLMESLPSFVRLIDTVQEWAVAVTTDKAPSESQRILAHLERIEERLTKIEEQQTELADEIQAGL